MGKAKKFKVGQKVRLVDRRKVMNRNIACGFAEVMGSYFGTIVTISEIKTDYGSDLKYVRVEENGWSWDIRFLQPLDEKPVSKVHDVDDFDVEDYILPNDYFIKKVIENGKAIICFVEHEVTGNVIKTVAICQEGDEFDIYKGVEICMYKTLRKIADKNLRKF